MTFLPFLISGLGIGAVYALSGVGLVILFRATGVLNFAFGAFGAIGAHCAWQLLEWKIPLSVAILAAVVVSTAISFLYGRIFAPMLSHRDTVVRAVGTLAPALVLIALMGIIWGELPRRLQFPTDQMFVSLFGVRLTHTRIIAILLAVVMVGAITLLLNRTRLGLDMRALANDRDLSAILGVRILYTETAAWVITGIFSGFAGLLLADLVRLQGTFLTLLVIPAIAAAILGQLRSLWQTAVAGLLIGIAEAALTPVAWISPYRAAAPFIIALVAVTILGSTAKAVLKDR
ncbi:branched-chain amino acid ABC transporter permease [Rhizobium ruizarguesonis]|jgi:branched-chain amino acid transport system permease protein|uniref:branched-chain amino acid ABC transporter permease n=1 Tax=Rhizobium ruizarguesonis TaxID=2081791 RepID=UPI000372A6DF|nr:branched-chain amino acid ABC transporter permease [Rhizobium ruizarguesonis]NEH66194.1 branched-chain amino acid ABC transporter permease [Rhizobium ruizarguesonis]NEH80438.1 branched-chain amino acid ABC transporter permease [Rhizobium ruizarguesonis]NEI76045.1 branched-chain amino acid ABC transporter permease [Rhizobium ruizarguesonis]NEJ97029.1 branched-chain amino acid ABC transporter permease [Rhizobium ruizarguesonis]